jgi:ferric-dicitrate binding protein FerR (iron transport regulator)
MTNSKTPDSIQEAAYLWLAKMTSGDVDQAQQQQLQNWLAENPAHQQAYNVATAWTVKSKLNNPNHSN